jgi:tetratricopeptide (TPR) repeat protein
MTYWHLIIPPIVLIVAIVFLMKFIAQKKQEKKKNSLNAFVTRDVFQQKEDGKNSFETDNHLIIRVVDTFERIISNVFYRFFKKLGVFILGILERYIQYKREKNVLKTRNPELKNQRDVSFIHREKEFISLRKEEEKKILMERKEKFFRQEAFQNEQKKEDERPMVSEKITKEPRRVSLMRDDAYETSLIERIALNPRDVEAYEMLGDYYIDRKNFTDAKDCYKQVLKLNPMSRGAKMRMRRLERVLAEDRNML